jgi:hypothetical protein
MKNTKKTLTLLLLITLTTATAHARIPIPPDAWVNTTNLLPQYYETITNQYPNIGGVYHRALLFGDTTFNPTNGVLAYDREDGYLPLTITGTIDTHTPGTYTLHYSATDSANQTTRFHRTIQILPQGTIAQIQITGRFGPNDIRPLNNTYQNTLATNLTFIRYDVAAAPPNATYTYREITRNWPNKSTSATNQNPPTATEWTQTTQQEFYRDLYICRELRQDRWFKITTRLGTNTDTRIYGIKGDPGQRYDSPDDGKRYTRLSQHVDDPMTVAQQHKYFSQGITFGYNWPIALQKRMGAYARQITAGKITPDTTIMKEDVLHARPVFTRYFSAGDPAKTQKQWWANAKKYWQAAAGYHRNESYLTSYQIPVTETTSGALPANPQTAFIAHVEDIYYAIHKIDPQRIIACAPTGIGSYSIYDSLTYTNLKGRIRHGFPDKTNQYFKTEFHGFNMDLKFIGFEHMPFIGTYSKMKIKHVSDHTAPVFYYNELRRWMRLDKQYGDKVEACLQEQFNIITRNPDGTFGYYTLPFITLRHSYIGSHYLNNLPYFANDFDGDGLSNDREKQLNSNPFDADTDGDGIFDLDEDRWGLDILRNDADEDLDGDGLSNLTEALYSKNLGWKIATKTLRFPLLDAHGKGLTDTNGNPILVTPRADRPEGQLLARPDQYTQPPAERLYIPAPGLRANDQILINTNQPTTLNIITPPTNGTLTINNDGSFLYDSPANGTAPDTFTYAIAGTTQTSATVKVTLKPYIPLNLEAHWLLDETTGTTAHDTTTNHHTGTLHGGHWTTKARTGGAYTSKTNQYIQIGTQWNTNDWAVAAWIYIPNPTTGAAYLLNGTNTRTRISIRHWRRRRIGIGYPAAKNGTEFNYEIPLKQWTHIIWARHTNGDTQLYINGLLQDTLHTTNNCPCPCDRIAYKFNGTIDDLRIYTGNTTPAQARRIYTNSQLTTYAAWRQQQWGTNSPANTTQTADYDHDGIQNLTEFALNLDPKNPPTNQPLPRIITTNNQINLTYNRRKNTALKYHYHFSTNLTQWTELIQHLDYTLNTDTNHPLNQIRITLKKQYNHTNPCFIRTTIQDDE